jgi:two-component system cell cycle response regulator DivK
MIVPREERRKEMFARTQRILIVDDEPDCLYILEQILTRAGYEVDKALGGEAALRKLGQNRYDLLMTDLAMPKTNGLDVIAAVKEDPGLAHMPVLATTAHIWDSIADCAGNAGCDGFLSKPMDRNHILRTVDEHLRRRRPRPQSRPLVGASGPNEGKVSASAPMLHTELRPLCERPSFSRSPAPRLH